jgi:hypothetical protein
MKKNLYKVYVADAAGWDRDCPSSEDVFFSLSAETPGYEGYVHMIEGGTRPAGHVLIRGHKEALAVAANLNRSGDWSTETDPRGLKRPWYRCAKEDLEERDL